MATLRAARIFDGQRLIEADTVTLAEGRFTGLGAEEAGTVDLGDVTLLPGLVDAHVHLGFDAGDDPVGRLTAIDDEELLAGMRVAARQQLAAGVTTVRDLGDRNYLAVRLKVEEGLPLVLAAGPPVTPRRGHCWYLGGEADGEQALREQVRRHAAAGVDVIKVMASGGELTPGTHAHQPQYSRAELRAVVGEARAHGLPTAAHAHGASAVADAVAAGFDSIEHCSFMTEDGIGRRPDVVAALAAAPVTVSATLARIPGIPLPPRLAVRLRALLGHLAGMRAAGVSIIASSDAGIGPSRPHGVLPHALPIMVEDLGFTAAHALRALTSEPARLCGVGHRKGRIAVGYDADLVAVAGNPLEDPYAVLDVRGVWCRGRRVPGQG